ncbi:hypothetical protein HY990_02825 [Candidatus Micrarchaeota archaeon]|nr:hypothetical protein [Candidatus Micrarchaeota archaeon]
MVRVIKQNDKCYLELPPDLISFEELELFKLKDGFYLISLPLAAKTVSTVPKSVSAPVKPPTISTQMSDQQRAVLKKLMSIRFENRTPEQVSKSLTDEEKLILKEIERRGFVNIFKGIKYRDGVYNINDSAYSQMVQIPSGTSAVRVATNGSSSSSSPVSASSATAPEVLLRSKGFVVIVDKNEARVVSDKLASELKSGHVVGIKGFDGKVYLVTRTYFENGRMSINKILKEDMDVASIAVASKLDVDGASAILHLMAESGEILEKRKGIFCSV